ncbi:UDP-2,3-diacylglucosamine hydrolase [Rhodospirillum rubrum]|nr:UDP-2,3-diacylglucosamine hydrolase [Rhodospirillum rubrum]MBK1675316.1 UDP-2,3-diacylglucosamine hydrolase [Rhodospirillum rubrum]
MLGAVPLKGWPGPSSPAGAAPLHRRSASMEHGRALTAMTDFSRRYRAIFLSDIHLGTRGCKADILLDFLRQTESETLYLVGDIVDGWRLRKHWNWPQSHNDVVQKLLRKARKGARVVFIPGNHDEFARSYCDADFGDIKLMREAVHQAADGKRYLIIHGDEFDGVVKYAKWLAKVGDWAYVWLLEANHWFNVVRHRIGLPYWSLSKYLKHKVKNAVKYIDDFETSMAEVARLRGMDGIVCGHIHHAEIRPMGDVLYCNDGDWVESCTALVEHFDGRMELIHWSEERRFSMFQAYADARAGGGGGLEDEGAEAAVGSPARAPETAQ